MTFWVLEDVLALDMEEAKGNRSRQQRDQGILLKLIGEDGSITFTFWTDGHSRFGISDGDIEA